MPVNCQREDQTFGNSYYDRNANALLKGAREEDGGGSGIALQTTANGACFFNAACTGLFGGNCTNPTDTDWLALPLRHTVIRYGVVQLETLVQDKQSMYRRFDAYDTSVQDIAQGRGMDMEYEDDCGEDIPILTEDIARACLVAALFSITKEFSEGSHFCLPLLAGVTRVNFRCFCPGNNT